MENGFEYLWEPCNIQAVIFDHDDIVWKTLFHSKNADEFCLCFLVETFPFCV